MLWGHLYGVLIVGEPETVFAVTGSALIASGVVSLSLRPSPQKGGAACEAAASCGDPATPPCRTHSGGAALPGHVYCSGDERDPYTLRHRAQGRP